MQLPDGVQLGDDRATELLSRFFLTAGLSDVSNCFHRLRIPGLSELRSPSNGSACWAVQLTGCPHRLGWANLCWRLLCWRLLRHQLRHQLRHLENLKYKWDNMKKAVASLARQAKERETAAPKG